MCVTEQYIIYTNAVNEERCTRGALRLTNGEFPNEGRLEVCIENHWGSICSDMFDEREVNVSCRQLGFTDGETCMYMHAHVVRVLRVHAHIYARTYNTHIHICTHSQYNTHTQVHNPHTHTHTHTHSTHNTHI